MVARTGCSAPNQPQAFPLWIDRRSGAEGRSHTNAEASTVSPHIRQVMITYTQSVRQPATTQPNSQQVTIPRTFSRAEQLRQLTEARKGPHHKAEPPRGCCLTRKAQTHATRTSPGTHTSSVLQQATHEHSSLRVCQVTRDQTRADPSSTSKI